MAARPHTITPDALSKSPKSAVVEVVTDKRVLQDSTNAESNLQAFSEFTGKCLRRNTKKLGHIVRPSFVSAI